MRSTAVIALLGATVILLIPWLPPLWLICSMVILLLLLYWHWRFFYLRLLLIMMSAFSFALWHAHLRLAWYLPQSLENKVVMAQGLIVSVPISDKLHTSFVFSLTRLEQQTVAHEKVKLNWYGKHPRLHVGDTWQLRVKLKRVHGFANPGSFDYEKYMLQQDIHAVGYVRDAVDNHLVNSHWYHHPIDRLRQYLAVEIERSLANSTYMPMIMALVVGEKRGIQATQWQVLQRTGTNHLLVIAGLHIGMISSVIFFLTHFFWRCSRTLVLILPARQAAAIVTLLGAVAYSALAGFSIPTQRALVMITIFMVSLLARRYLPLGLGLSFAVLGVLLLQPLATLSVSFWLSFAAVGIIFYAMSARLNPGGIYWRLGRLQVAVSLGLIPFTLLIFHNASLIAPLANAIVIPLVGFIVVPLSLVAVALHGLSIFLSQATLHLAAMIMAIVWHILSWFAAHPWFAWQHAIYTFWSFLAAVLGILLLLAPRGFPARYLGMVWLLPIIFLQPSTPKFGDARFTLLDVGQGLAAVVQTAHHVLVFDTGAKYSTNFDLGTAVVIPFLRSQGISKVDRLVISHGDNDHIGGAQSLLRVIPVKQITTSVPERFKPLIADYCLAGQHWQWDGVKFRFLYPDKLHLGLDNNSSCVLRVSVGNKHLLLTGDIEKFAEDFLLTRERPYLPAHIIVAPHHGSKTSSSLAFLQAVQPRYVFYPTGYLNRFHFPSTIVQQRYARLAATAFSTAQDGAISLLLSRNSKVKPIGYRQQIHQFWRQSV